MSDGAHDIRLKKIVEEIEDYAIILLDRLGYIDNWNRGAQKLKGYRADEIIGKHFRIFYTQKDQQAGKPEALLSAAIASGASRDEGWRVRRDGSLFWGSIVITSIHEDGEVIGFTKVTRDLTEKKQAETLSIRYIAQLESRASEMEQLAYAASHDLREPLRTIQGYFHLFQQTQSSAIGEKGSHYIDIIGKSLQRMDDLIRDIMQYAVIGSEKSVESIDCNQLVKEVSEDLATEFADSGGILRTDNLPIVLGHRNDLRRLFQNLIDNALKFAQKGTPPEIFIQARQDPSGWIFSVSDNGIGIEVSQLDKIFLMFHRLHPRDRYPGSGIGLSYCKKIVEQHNGRIWARSTPGLGSTFFFTLGDPTSPLHAIGSETPIE